MITLNLLSGFSVAAFGHGIDPGLTTVTPICLSENNQIRLSLDNETTMMQLEFVSIIYFNDIPRYGYDSVYITQETYDKWNKHCEENQYLVAHATAFGPISYLPFKTENQTYRRLFVPDMFNNRANFRSSFAQRNSFSTYDRIYNHLSSITKLDDPYKRIANYLINTKDLTVNLRLGHWDHAETLNNSQLSINLSQIGQHYETETDQVGIFSLERLITHELIRAVMSNELTENEVIELTNQILHVFGYQDIPRH